MLSNQPTHTTIPATDMGRAKKFYTGKLGLVPESESPGGIMFRCAGTMFVLFPSQGAASGAFTQIGWSVENIEAEVADLKNRGVIFEEYNLPSLKTINSVATTAGIKAAWFKDSEGNMLSLVQFT